MSHQSDEVAVKRSQLKNVNTFAAKQLSYIKSLATFVSIVNEEIQLHSPFICQINY